MWVGHQPKRTTPNLEDQWTALRLTLSIDLTGFGDPTWSLSSGQYSSSGHKGVCKRFHHDKGAVYRGWCVYVSHKISDDGFKNLFNLYLKFTLIAYLIELFFLLANWAHLIYSACLRWQCERLCSVWEHKWQFINVFLYQMKSHYCIQNM
jgi:hypothetical protein